MTWVRWLRLAQTHRTADREAPLWEAGPLTWHHEVNHGPVVPGEALGPAQLRLAVRSHQVPPAAPGQAPHPPFVVAAGSALPAPGEDELGEAQAALALPQQLQQLQLQQVAAAPHTILPLLHVDDALQLEAPAGTRLGGHSPGTTTSPSSCPAALLPSSTNLASPALLHGCPSPMGMSSTCFS